MATLSRDGRGTAGRQAAHQVKGPWRDMRRLYHLLSLLLAGLGLAPCPGGAEPAPPVELVRIRQQIKDLESRLQAFEAQQNDLVVQRQRLEGELKLAALRLGEWEAELARAEQAAATATRDAEEARVALEQAVARLVRVGDLLESGSRAVRPGEHIVHAPHGLAPTRRREPAHPW